MWELILLPTSGEVWLGDAGLLVPGPARHTAAAHQPEHDDDNLGLLLSLLLLLSTAWKLLRLGMKIIWFGRKGHRITPIIVSLSVIYWILLVAGDKRHITVLVWPELCLWRDRRIRNLARLAGVCRGRDKCYRYSASPLRHLHHTTPWPSLQRTLILLGYTYNCTLKRSVLQTNP